MISFSFPEFDKIDLPPTGSRIVLETAVSLSLQYCPAMVPRKLKPIATLGASGWDRLGDILFYLGYNQRLLLPGHFDQVEIGIDPIPKPLPTTGTGNIVFPYRSEVPHNPLFGSSSIPEAFDHYRRHRGSFQKFCLPAPSPSFLPT